MIEKKLDFELVKKFTHASKEKAIVLVNNWRGLRTIERKFNILAKFPFIKAVGVECDYKTAKILSDMPVVEYVARQSRVSACDDVYDNFQTTGVNALLRAQLPSAFATNRFNLTGKGTRLCILDTGVSPHLDLCLPKNRIMHFKDFENSKNDAYDDNGHGTFVAGVALGNGTVSGHKIIGVAPEAELVSVKVISHTGESGAFRILEGMQWVMDNFKTYKIDTVCMSFGSEPLMHNDPLKLGAETLVKNGITVVCASGNSGKDNLKSPGISPMVITVGAVDNDYKEARFSSYGEYYGIKKPDVYAKGVNIRGLSNAGSYVEMSGTSVSAPYVAGAVCLLQQKFVGLSPHDAKKLILLSTSHFNHLPVLNLVPD